MQLREIISMAVNDLWQRKLRTCLNLIGIVIGCVCVLLTAVGTAGVEQAFRSLFESSEYATQIVVAPNGVGTAEPPPGTIVVEGEMDEERRERIYDGLLRRWRRQLRRESRWKISQDEVESFHEIPGVKYVHPESFVRCVASVMGDDLSLATELVNANIASPSANSSSIVGQLPTDDTKNTIAISELFAYRLGYRSDAEINRLVGKEIEVRFNITKDSNYSKMSKLFQKQLSSLQDTAVSPSDLANQATFALTFKKLIESVDQTSLSDKEKQIIKDLTKETKSQKVETRWMTRRFLIGGVVQSGQDSSIASIFRRWFHGTSGSLLAHPDVAAELQVAKPGVSEFSNVMVIVENAKQLEPVSDAIRDRGMEPNSSLQFLDYLENRIKDTSWAIYMFALAILLTSAIGISNTLIISVMQRTPEFGILKSVGAHDRDLLFLMLCEGAILGFIGATVAVVFSWILSIVGHSVAIAYVSRNLKGQLEGDLFQFSWPPILFVYLISITICVVASILPAWRAAKLDPVVAMRRK